LGARGGGIRFEDVTVDAGLGKLAGPGLGVVCADVNGDRWPDLLIANDGHVNWLLINQRNGSFAEEGATRGIAYNCYIGRGGRFKTYVAEVVELARVDGRLAVKRVVCALDAGLAVNPNTLKAQIEGGIGFALTNTLKSRITFSNGGTDQSNFFDYQLLRIDEMPEIVPIILPSDRPPQGFGEVVLAPVAPAIAQALLQANGKRIDTMPLPTEAFRR